jgi:hypothetical protein
MPRQAPRFARAKPEHAAQVAASLRESDRVELLALGIEDPAARLHAILGIKGDARAVLDRNGQAVALFGCAEVQPGAAAPWMLCADGISRGRKLILRHGPRWLRAWARRWGALRNASHAGNKMHHRFIEAIGFKWAGAMKINGHDFRVFEYV